MYCWLCSELSSLGNAEDNSVINIHSPGYHRIRSLEWIWIFKFNFNTMLIASSIIAAGAVGCSPLLEVIDNIGDKQNKPIYAPALQPERWGLRTHYFIVIFSSFLPIVAWKLRVTARISAFQMCSHTEWLETQRCGRHYNVWQRLTLTYTYKYIRWYNT